MALIQIQHLPLAIAIAMVLKQVVSARVKPPTNKFLSSQKLQVIILHMHKQYYNTNINIYARETVLLLTIIHYHKLMYNREFKNTTKDKLLFLQINIYKHKLILN